MAAQFMSQLYDPETYTILGFEEKKGSVFLLMPNGINDNPISCNDIGRLRDSLTQVHRMKDLSTM